MIALIDFVTLAAATARITRLITTDTIFENIRERIWSRFSPSDTKIGYLITCDWCTSIYVASPLVIMYKIWPEPTITVALMFALSAAAGIINRAN